MRSRLPSGATPLERLQRARHLTSVPAPAVTSIAHLSRQLTCNTCHLIVQVYEFAWGARTPSEHRYLNPSTYECGDCTLTRKEQ